MQPSSDRWIVACFVLIAGAVWQPLSVGIPLLLLATAGAALLRNRNAGIVALALFATAHSAHEWQQLDQPLPDSVNGTATIVRDPKVVNHATNAEVRIDGRHYQLWAYGTPGFRLRPLLAGDRLYLSGSTRPLSGVATSTYRRRHIAGSVNVDSVSFVDHGSAVAQSANGLRLLIARGAQSMPATERTLLIGFVYGDDRDEDEQTRDDFQAAGLSHLLAVSGENVAFVLFLMAPLLGRFSIWGRFVGGVSVLVLFGFVTRWEPSVVRAEMMALVALVAVLQGRAVSKWRCLCVGSSLALLADPFLIGSVGFLLSVSACFGMAALGELFFVRLRGPLWVRRAIAYSAAAQLGVGPVQVAVFHQFPTVGLLTNVLAEPIAGFVMVWGVVVGVIAGVVPWPQLGLVLHIPDWFLLSIVRHIAHAGATLEATPVGRGMAALFTVAMVALLVRARPATNFDERDGSSSVGISS